LIKLPVKDAFDLARVYMDPSVVSLLSKLEPVLGITFALNLAYIGLPRFRYREAIRKHVRQKMEDMKDIPEQHCETDWYKQIVRLGNLGDNDGHAVDGKEASKKSRDTLPSGAWSFVYAVFYEWHIDRVIAVSFSISCATLLFLGVAHELKLLDWSMGLFTEKWIGYWLLFTWLMSVFPPSLGVGGNFVVSGANRFVNDTTKNLKLTLKDNAQKAELILQGQRTGAVGRVPIPPRPPTRRD
jgi:hypothetical protein